MHTSQQSVPYLNRRRGRRCLFPSPQDRTPGPLAQEDRGGHRKGDGQGMEGPESDRQADGAEPHRKGLGHPLGSLPGGQGLEGAHP